VKKLVILLVVALVPAFVEAQGVTPSVPSG
jgi:hypothetical protein